jgi:Pyruvate/2-oxoacid:ferredoxin oxidoreductase delta subunit
MKRNIIHIDQEKCNGCGLCVSACAEGAIQLIDGKARLVTDSYCDGLGACLGHCPMDAITIIERDADAFDEKAVEAHLESQGRKPHSHAAPHPAPSLQPAPHHHGGCPGSATRILQPGGHSAPSGGCPGSMLQMLKQKRFQQQPAGERPAAVSAAGAPPPSELRQWPVQLHLVPVSSPAWENADLLLCADCVPVAYAGFQQHLLRGRQIIIACPKLDNTANYLDKLTAILRDNDVRSLAVARMEVPCCSGLARLAENAVAASGKDIPLEQIVVNIDGGLQ